MWNLILGDIASGIGLHITENFSANKCYQQTIRRSVITKTGRDQADHIKKCTHSFTVVFARHGLHAVMKKAKEKKSFSEWNQHELVLTVGWQFIDDLQKYM